jgi:hypothetical protein
MRSEMGYGNFVTKSFFNPRWGLMFALGRFRLVSDLVVSMKKTPEATLAPNASTRFPSVDMRTALATMKRDGLCTNLNLDACTVAEIVSFASSTPCFWREDRSVTFLCHEHADVERRIGKTVLLGHYLDIEDRCEAVRAVSHDPVLLHLATLYLGAEPGQTEARLWWSFASSGTSEDRVKAGQIFHYDLDDYRNIAFFFHLTQVDESSGPHVYVKTSHRRKPLRYLLSSSRQCTDQEMVARYGAENVATLCGPAGFGFASDPFGYHKGASPLKGHRLMLRVRYTINHDGTAVDKSH